MAGNERVSIENILVEDYRTGLREKDLAFQEFLEAISNIPSGLPHPDGSLRIHNAANRTSAAREKALLALDRLNAFRYRGVIPENLKMPQDE